MSDSRKHFIEKDGDPREKEYWPLFLRKDFPSYEKTWSRYIVPVTGRPDRIDLLSDEELAKRGKSDRDICFAQLHYTVFCHLRAAFDIRNQSILSFENFTSGIIRLCSAQDVAFELLERHRNPEYDPRCEKKSQKARNTWMKHDNQDIQVVCNMRYYRNRLVHGRIPPYVIFSNNILMVPKIGLEDRYLDWRAFKNPKSLLDFDPASSVLNAAWNDAVKYLETAWQKYLLQE